MRKILVLCILMLLLGCESSEEKQKIIDAQIKEKLEIVKIQEKEREILEKKRVKQKILMLKEQADEKRRQEELLGSSLLEETSLMNKEALDLLNSESTPTGSLGDYDTVTDSSITKFVNNKVAFSNLEYVPEDLVPMVGEYIEDFKGGSLLRKEALSALDNLAQNYYLVFNSSLKVVSAYRSFEYQQGIKDRGCSDDLCAKAGYSEHQSGLAVDFWEASEEKRFIEDDSLKKYFEWMKQEGYKYGFTNTYQKGIEIDGYSPEPWHWRYVGEDLALILHEYSITFAEYMNTPENY